MTRIAKRATDLPKRSLWEKIRDVALTDVVVLAKGGVSEGSLAALEQQLIEADFGVETTMQLVAGVEQPASRGLIKTEAQFLEALRLGVETALRHGNSDPALAVAAQSDGDPGGRRQWRRKNDIHRKALPAVPFAAAVGARRGW